MPNNEGLTINLPTLTGLTVIEAKERILEAKAKRQEFTRKTVGDIIRGAAHTVCQRYNRHDLYVAIVQRLLAETRGVFNDDQGLSPN